VGSLTVSESVKRESSTLKISVKCRTVYECCCELNRQTSHLTSDPVARESGMLSSTLHISHTSVWVQYHAGASRLVCTTLD